MHKKGCKALGENMEKSSMEIHEKVYKISSKELGMQAWSKCRKELVEEVCKRSKKEVGKMYAKQKQGTSKESI